MPVVRADIPKIDDCPILTRLKAFIVDQGVITTLEHTFRDRKGRVLDLSDWLAIPESESGSVSSSAQPAGTVKIRVKEWMAEGPCETTNPIWTAWGDSVDPAKGVVQAELSEEMVQTPGIYEINWAIINEDGNPVAVDRGIMSVERSLFPSDVSQLYCQRGPATLQEIRMMMMDSSKNENLLLDEVEFADEQILLALAKPIRQWNETPPPIERFTTRNFPFRGAWTSAVLGELHIMMANHYRRNRLAHTAGGVSVDDKNKEREYMAEGQRLQQEYAAWLANKKVEINMKKFAGQSVSAYSGHSGW